jgi:hypothetical protein
MHTEMAVARKVKDRSIFFFGWVQGSLPTRRLNHGASAVSLVLQLAQSGDEISLRTIPRRTCDRSGPAAVPVHPANWSNWVPSGKFMECWQRQRRCSAAAWVAALQHKLMHSRLSAGSVENVPSTLLSDLTNMLTINMYLKVCLTRNSCCSDNVTATPSLNQNDICG